MASRYLPEIQEVDERSRTWSLGSQLLGRYNTELRNESSFLPGYRQRASMSSGVIDIQDDTAQPRLQAHMYLNTSGRLPSFSATTIEVGSECQEQRPPIRASTTFYDRIITDWWWWELFSWFVSFCCVAAIVGVLLFYDGKRQPEHVFPGITLNALIAVLAAIAKSALIVPISEAIGQLKWIWFKKKESNLWDFYTFDNASRGPWGSLMLLGTTTCKHLVSLGAVITILVLAFEPFFQQIVSFPRRLVVQGESTVSVATSYNVIDDVTYTAGFSNRLSSLSLDVGGLMRSKTSLVRPVTSLCPTGNCNWTSYTSLGVCHKCVDLSRLLSPICDKSQSSAASNGAVNNPCGVTFNDTFVVGTFGYKRKYSIGLSTLTVGTKSSRSSSASTWTSTAFQREPNPIIDFYIAFTPGGESEIRKNSTAVLMECIFHWCVKAFEASHQQGVLKEKVKAVYTAMPTDSTVSDDSQTKSNVTTSSNDPFAMVAQGKSYQVGANITHHLTEAITAHLPRAFREYDTDSNGLFPGRWDFVQTAPHDVHQVLSPVAEALTNNIRTSSENNTEIRKGIAWGSENFVEIQWLWITLPGFSLFCTLVLMCATIVKSRNENTPSWKSSALATLLHGLTEEVRGQFDTKASESEVEAIARKVRVKLSMRENGTLINA